jgi:tetratricopeptide (TPR) repeat protein
MTILEQAFEKTKQFRFRLRLGQIKMQQMKRMARSLREDVAKNPTDAEAIKTYKDFLREQAEEELQEYSMAAEAYPTDTSFKYEMAKRLLVLQRFSDAIPLLQQSVQDPKLRVDASVELGKAFLEADFVDEAVDTLRGMTETYQITGDTRAKEIWYWYGRSLEKQNTTPEAIKCYSRVTQWDFNYRDVQQRIKALRAKQASV